MSNFREELEKEQLCTGERRYTKCDIDSITSHHALKALDRGEVLADVMEKYSVDRHAIESARQRRERMIQSCIVKEKKLPTKRFNTDDY